MGHRRARHFYPRSPCGERPAIGRRDRAGRDISIHALLAESDLLGRDDDMTQLEFLSTLSLRRATMGYPVSGQHYSISIHALLAESDRLSMSAAPLARRISIHALLAESDPRKAVTTRGNHRYFYPRSPCGERRWSMSAAPPARPISIHALLAESDSIDNSEISDNLTFLSTLSLRRATRPDCQGAGAGSNFYPRSPCGERPD